MRKTRRGQQDRRRPFLAEAIRVMRDKRDRRPTQLRLADGNFHAAQIDRAPLRETREELRVRGVDGPVAVRLVLVVPAQLPRVADDDGARSRRFVDEGSAPPRHIDGDTVDKSQRLGELCLALRDTLIDGPAFAESVEIFVVGQVAHELRGALLHVASQVDGRAGGEMRQHVAPCRKAEEVFVVDRLRVLTVVVGVFKDAVPPL